MNRASETPRNPDAARLVRCPACGIMYARAGQDPDRRCKGCREDATNRGE